jgi:predicted permease
VSLSDRVRSWLRASLRRRALERAMEDEFQFHRARYAEDLERSGLPPEEARRRAYAEFGSVDARKEECRSMLGLRLLDELRVDVRYAWRLLRRSPAFAIIAVLSLGLGIGANTAIFTLLDTVMLKSLPVNDPGRLFFVDNSGGKSGGNSGPPYPCFEILRDRNRYFSGMAAFKAGASMNVTIDGMPERVRGQYASASYFDVLGVPAVYGRVFTAADEGLSRAGTSSSPVAVISETFWERRFGRDPAIVGKTIQVGRTWVTIVGVTPKAFRGLQVGSPADLTVPMAVSGNRLTATENWWFSVVGRLKDDVPVEQARLDVDALFQRYMTDIGLKGDARVYFDRIVLVPAGKGLNDLRRDFATPLWIVTTIVGLVLLIGCANVANLLIARASARRGEIALRLAIGASRGRLIRQLITEGALLAALGAAGGLLFARWGVATLVRFFEGGQQWIMLEPHFDGRVLAFTAGVSTLTAFLFSVAPALQATRVDAARPDDGGRTSLARPRARVGQALVVVQVTLSLVLLSVAALFIRTLHNLNNVQSGFSRQGVLTMHVEATMLPPYDKARNAYTEHAQLARMWGDLLDGLGALPGVSSAALSTITPLSRRDRGVVIAVPGEPPKRGPDRGIHVNHVSPAYFETFGIRLLDGRPFAASDQPTSPRVAILNATAAKFYFGPASPIGRVIDFPGQDIPDPYRVVGVVEDTRYDGLRKEPERMAYLPVSQSIDRLGGIIVGIRGAIDPSRLVGGVRDAAARSVPAAFVSNIVTMNQQIDDSMLQERLVARLASVFGALALVLACIGIYGVLSYAVVRRTREIGIRLAIGAQKRGMIWLVLRETIVLVAIGLMAGVPLILWAARYVKTQLFQVAPNDPLAIAAAMFVLACAAIAAAYLPARRASGIDPLIALRYE